MNSQSTCASDRWGTTERAAQIVKEHPDEAVITAFVTGAVVGVAIGAAIGGASSGTSWKDRRVAEGLGERLLSSLDSLLPDSISKSFGRS